MCKVKGVMPFLKLFVSNILIFLVEAKLTSTETDIFKNITPLHYKLRLWSHIESDYFVGLSRIIIRIEKEIQIIRFLSTASIINAKLEKDPINVTEHINSTYIPTNVTYYSAMEVVTLHFNETIERGYYVLEVKYQNNYTDSIKETDGFIRTSCMDVNGNQKWMVTTQTRVGCPRAIFPCWNNPRYTTTFEVSIKHPQNYMAISNSKVHCFSSSKQERDMTWTHFQSTPPLFPHCINIVVIPTYHAHKLGSNIRMYTLIYKNLSQSKFNFTKIIIEDVTHYLKTTTNSVDHCKAAFAYYIAIRNFSLEIITTPSFVLFREEDISVSTSLRPKYKQKVNVALVIVQQMVYQWILQSTKLLTYSSLSWLQDVSKFFTVLILEQILPEFKVYHSPIQSIYKSAHFTSSFFNMENIIKFISFSRTPLAHFCDRNFSMMDKYLLNPS